MNADQIAEKIAHAMDPLPFDEPTMPKRGLEMASPEVIRRVNAGRRKKARKRAKIAAGLAIAEVMRVVDGLPHERGCPAVWGTMLDACLHFGVGEREKPLEHLCGCFRGKIRAEFGLACDGRRETKDEG